MLKTDMGQLLVEQFQPAEALPHLEQSVELLGSAAVEYPAVAAYRESLASALDNLAQALIALGRFDEAISAADRAAVELSGLARAFPNLAPYKLRSAVVESTAAQALDLAGRTESALQRFASAEKLFNELESNESPSPDASQAAALMFARYGEALSGNEGADIGPILRRAGRHWGEVLELSQDPQFLCGAAWFFTTCPEEGQRDADRACELASRALQNAADNSRYRLTLAVAQAMADRKEESLQTAEAPTAKESPMSPLFDLARAIALQASGKPEEAAKAETQATTWIDANLPGSWELRTLRRLAKKRLTGATASR
jgi:tetratricopeptide (TPR) repeat protein